MGSLQMWSKSCSHRVTTSSLWGMAPSRQESLKGSHGTMRTRGRGRIGSSKCALNNQVKTSLPFQIRLQIELQLYSTTADTISGPSPSLLLPAFLPSQKMWGWQGWNGHRNGMETRYGNRTNRQQDCKGCLA